MSFPSKITAVENYIEVLKKDYEKSKDLLITSILEECPQVTPELGPRFYSKGKTLEQLFPLTDSRKVLTYADEFDIIFNEYWQSIHNLGNLLILNDLNNSQGPV